MNVYEFDSESECESKSEWVFEFESEFECVITSSSMVFRIGWLGYNRCARLSCNAAHVWLQGTD